MLSGLLSLILGILQVILTPFSGSSGDVSDHVDKSTINTLTHGVTVSQGNPF